MTYFLIFLAVIVAAVAALYVVGLNKPEPEAAAFVDALEPPVASLPPVLLPGTPAPADVDRLRFSLGLRGYRMDQVDEVLDRLRDELAAKELRIAELEASLSGTHDAGSPAAAVVSPAPAAAAEPATVTGSDAVAEAAVSAEDSGADDAAASGEKSDRAGAVAAQDLEPGSGGK